ncbi:MAG: hypothetical protein A3F67_07335 [Verrucomicrobia bacterium RIFCSPHIGHO2_12_FULL_41_10]|nr:MAG: hypothetical protein A3F67_07335 [Verrucomicrobia bacterium RIFCSPHIGHO2_12_FULL_41_10]HLB33729.1 type II secretion system F family protein [Chthoniobacterales bacterium]
MLFHQFLFPFLGFKNRPRLFYKTSIPSKSLLLFTRQLAILLKAGLPLIRGLTLLAQQKTDTVLHKTILQLIASIQAGESLSDALACHPKIFNKLFVAMVRAGEASGILENSLHRITDFQEKRLKIAKKIKSALLYPTIVLLMTFIIMGFLLGFIIPRFEAIFSEILNGRPLPSLTQLVITISREFQHNALWLVLALGIVSIGFHLVIRTPQGEMIRDSFLLKIPLIGNLLKKNSIARCSRTLGTLINHGVPIFQALTIAQETAGNAVMSQALEKIQESLKEGDSMTDPMQASTFFPSIVLGMIAVGEETGQLSEILLQIAEIYDEEVDHSTTTLISMIEPIFILLLALLVGTIVIALFLPLISMMNDSLI